jgi:hypothetical protein
MVKVKCSNRINKAILGGFGEWEVQKGLHEHSCHRRLASRMGIRSRSPRYAGWVGLLAEHFLCRFCFGANAAVMSPRLRSLVMSV